MNYYRFELVSNSRVVCTGEGNLESVSEIVDGHFRNFEGERFEAWKAEREEQGESALLLKCNGDLKLAFANPKGHKIARAWHYTKRRPI